MFGKMMPKEAKFFDLFNQHAEQSVLAARELVAMMSNYEAEKEARSIEIDRIEQQADRYTRETVRLLHSTFITPMDRDHMHQLISTMDDVVDLIQDCTETLSLYDVRSITDDIKRLAEISLKCCERMRVVVSLLGKSDAVEAMLKTCEEIDKLESDADRVMRSAISHLFREEQDVRELIKLKAIYELLESVTDRVEDVANLCEGIALENA
jgi:predicted phosphate transport protein (TIGR00153 family)